MCQSKAETSDSRELAAKQYHIPELISEQESRLQIHTTAPDLNRLFNQYVLSTAYPHRPLKVKIKIKFLWVREKSIWLPE